MAPRWDSGTAAALAEQRTYDTHHAEAQARQRVDASRDTWIGVLTFHVGTADRAEAFWEPATANRPDYVVLRLGSRVAARVSTSQAEDIYAGIGKALQEYAIAQDAAS